MKIDGKSKMQPDESYFPFDIEKGLTKCSVAKIIIEDENKNRSYHEITLQVHDDHINEPINSDNTFALLIGVQAISINDSNSKFKLIEAKYLNPLDQIIDKIKALDLNQRIFFVECYLYKMRQYEVCGYHKDLPDVSVFHKVKRLFENEKMFLDSIKSLFIIPPLALVSQNYLQIEASKQEENGRVELGKTTICTFQWLTTFKEEENQLYSLYSALYASKMIDCSKDVFKGIFGMGKFIEPVKWLIIGKNKYTSKNSLFYLIGLLISKGYFLILLLAILYSKSFSQALDSQETIKYINNKLIVFSDESDKSFIWQFKIENYGTIVQYSSYQTLLYNFNDIDNIIYEREDNQHFIKIYCKNKTCITSHFKIESKQQWDYLSIGVVSEIEAKKLVTALIHLKSLLINKDPFDN